MVFQVVSLGTNLTAATSLYECEAFHCTGSAYISGLGITHSYLCYFRKMDLRIFLPETRHGCMIDHKRAVLNSCQMMALSYMRKRTCSKDTSKYSYTEQPNNKQSELKYIYRDSLPSQTKKVNSLKA